MHIHDSAFAVAQAVSATLNTGIYSEFSIPLHGLRMLGMGADVFVELRVDTALEGANDSLDVDIWSDSEGTFATTPVVVAQAIKTIPALAGAGTRLYFKIPQATIAAGDTHIALKFVPRGTGDTTGGVVTALVTLEPGRDIVMPRGDTMVG